MARIVLEDVCKAYTGPRGERAEAMRNVSLDVADREFLVVVGPSGGGKTTTLRVIAGLEQPTSGTIRIGGQVVNALPPRDRDVAMVFQNYALYPHLTVYENLAFGLKLRNCPRPDIERRVRDAAALLGLGPLLDRLPKALSGGQRQRVAVGRAIVRQPKAFLFDEPLSNLDAPMRAQLRQELGALHRRLEATAVYVTHDQVEAMTMGDRIAVMNDGAIQQIADPATLYARPANLFVAGFIGAPPMNCFRGRLTADPVGAAFEADAGPAASGGLRVRLAAEPRCGPGGPAAAVMLGMRPEAVHLAPPAATAAGVASWPATVERVELLGAEALIHLVAAGQSFWARCVAGARPGRGEVVTVWVDPAACHLFDARTGQRLN
jgi:multiple sugar transport system ATP-binding protein